MVRLGALMPELDIGMVVPRIQNYGRSSIIATEFDLLDQVGAL
jgi:hypothetical protein